MKMKEILPSLNGLSLKNPPPPPQPLLLNSDTSFSIISQADLITLFCADIAFHACL